MSRIASIFPASLLWICTFLPLVGGNAMAADAPADPAPVTTSADDNEPFIPDDVWQGADERTRGVTTDGEGQGGMREGDGDMAGSLVRLFFGLVLVVGLVVLVAWMIKRSGLHRRLPGVKGTHLEIMETLPLGPRRSVTLLRVGGHFALVAHGDQAMATVLTLAGSELVGEAAPAHPPQPAAAAADAALAQQPDATGSEERPGDAAVGQPPASVDDFRNRLQRLLGGGRP